MTHRLYPVPDPPATEADDAPPLAGEVAALTVELVRIESRLAKLPRDVAQRLRDVARIAAGAA